MEEKQIKELLLQSLEHEQGGVKVYQAALKCAVNEDLKEEWEKYLEQTEHHVQVLQDVFAQMQLDAEEQTPGRKIVHDMGASLVAAMEADSGERLSELRVDGGAAVNNFLMQFQADILGRPIVRPVDIETTALGAAYLAGLACGFWKSVKEIESFWRADRRFEPQMDSTVRERLFGEWRSAVARCRSN